MLYNSSDINLLIPSAKEAGYGIVPTTSTTLQLSMGDALAISVMKIKKFSKLDFKKIQPSGNLGLKLKTVEDLMLTKNKNPKINQKKLLFEGINLIEKKKFREYYSCKSGLGMGAKNFSWTAALYLDFKLNRS